jgi:hypothetical protein
MIPSPPDSHPHSPAAALGSLGLLGIGDALKQLPPVPPLPLHLGGPPMAATIRSLSSLRSKGKSGALRHDSSSAGWQSCALTPDPSGDSIDVRPRSDQRQAFGSGSCSSSASSARESTASSPCEIRQEEGDSDESLLASPFLGPHDLMTPPFERSEEEGGIRRHRGLGVHLGQQPPSPGALSCLPFVHPAYAILTFAFSGGLRQSRSARHFPDGRMTMVPSPYRSAHRHLTSHGR